MKQFNYFFLFTFLATVGCGKGVVQATVTVPAGPEVTEVTLPDAPEVMEKAAVPPIETEGDLGERQKAAITKIESGKLSALDTFEALKEASSEHPQSIEFLMNYVKAPLAILGDDAISDKIVEEKTVNGRAIHYCDNSFLSWVVFNDENSHEAMDAFRLKTAAVRALPKNQTAEAALLDFATQHVGTDFAYKTSALLRACALREIRGEEHFERLKGMALGETNLGKHQSDVSQASALEAMLRYLESPRRVHTLMELFAKTGDRNLRRTMLPLMADLRETRYEIKATINHYIEFGRDLDIEDAIFALDTLVRSRAARATFFEDRARNSALASAIVFSDDKKAQDYLLAELANNGPAFRDLRNALSGSWIHSNLLLAMYDRRAEPGGMEYFEEARNSYWRAFQEALKGTLKVSEAFMLEAIQTVPRAGEKFLPALLTFVKDEGQPKSLREVGARQLKATFGTKFAVEVEAALKAGGLEDIQ